MVGRGAPAAQATENHPAPTKLSGYEMNVIYFAASDRELTLVPLKRD